MKRLKTRLVLLSIGSFIASVLPLALTLFLKRGEYMTTVAQAVKLSVGFLIGAAFMLLKTMGKLKMPRRLTLYVVVTLMAYLLKPILSDIMLLGVMAIIGEVCDSLFFGIAIRRTRNAIADERCAESTAGRVEEVIKKYMGVGA